MVQARRNSKSREWYEAPEVDPKEVNRLNDVYGWAKYRVTKNPA